MNPQHEIEPFQLWLKDRCIWAEAHQKVLFFGLVLIVAAITLTVGFALRFTPTVWSWLSVSAFIAAGGGVASLIRRNIWLGGALGFVAMLLTGGALILLDYLIR